MSVSLREKALVLMNEILSPYYAELYADEIVALIGKCGGRSEDLDIHKIKIGDKIVYSNPNAGYDYDRDSAKKWLKLNEVYTIANIVIGDWRTDIYLEEKAGIEFNSVSFSATPTFSGKKVYNEDVIFMCKKHTRVNCGECFEVLPKCATEQKECLHDGDKMGGSDCPTICCKCGKSILAEKKECEHDWRCKDQFTGDKQYKGFLICIKCKDEFDARLEPEPKPKDRIEPIGFAQPIKIKSHNDAVYYITGIVSYLNLLSHHINKES